ncbi:MAG: hypothetical protein QM778_14155 [Myxococcales bacterium]
MTVKPRSKPKSPATRGARERAASEREPTRRDKAEKKRGDVVLIQGISEDGEALAVLRAREDRVEAGIVRCVKEGDIGQGELVRLKPRPESPLVCDVEVQLPENALNARGGSDAHHGPAQVATRTYRDNWDAIWNKPGKKNQLPN